MPTLFFIGGHDFYAGHTEKGISKVVCTALAYLFFKPLLLYPLISMIVDLVKLCDGKYKDQKGKIIKP